MKNGGEIKFVIPEGHENKFLWRESWRLAWPVFIGQAVSMSMILLSRVMIGTIGESSLAALGMGQMIFFAMVMGLASVSVGMVALMAREVGAGNPREASRIFGQGVVFGTLISVGLSIFGLIFTRHILVLLHVPTDVLTQSTRFMQVLFLGLPMASLSFFMGGGMRGAGDTRTPMILIVITVLLNIFIQWVLVFGKFGLPKLGIFGAGLAMSISFAIALVMFSALFVFKLTAIPIEFSGLRIDWATIKRIVKIGGPTAIEFEPSTVTGPSRAPHTSSA